MDFDDTIEGERLRRFEITSGRGYFRSIDTFLKLRRAEKTGQLSDGPLSVVSGPLLGGDDMATVIAEGYTPNEPTHRWEGTTNQPTDPLENVTNKATEGPLSVVKVRFLGGGCPPLEHMMNEPNGDDEIVTNGTNDAHKNVSNEPTSALRRRNVRTPRGRESKPRTRTKTKNHKPMRANRLRKTNAEAHRAARQPWPLIVLTGRRREITRAGPEVDLKG